jgi:hypothetical protein
MDAVTTSVGEELRKFNDRTCAAFITRELERECEARARRALRKAKKLAASHKLAAEQPCGAGHQAAPDLRSSVSGEITNLQQPAVELGSLDAPAGVQSDAKAPRLKEFSFETYKLHALGDYSSTIRRYGTTDSYSTEPVSYPVTFMRDIPELSCVG